MNVFFERKNQNMVIISGVFCLFFTLFYLLVDKLPDTLKRKVPGYVEYQRDIVNSLLERHEEIMPDISSPVDLSTVHVGSNEYFEELEEFNDASFDQLYHTFRNYLLKLVRDCFNPKAK